MRTGERRAAGRRSGAQLLQVSIADALQHTRQLTLMQRMAGGPVRGEDPSEAAREMRVRSSRPVRWSLTSGCVARDRDGDFYFEPPRSLHLGTSLKTSSRQSSFRL
jgi:hypothetical protein